MICSRCKKRLAVVFVTRLEGSNTLNEGYCLKCAKDLGIKQVEEVMDKMGITDEDIDSISSQFMEIEGQGDPENDEFTPGGAATFPFLQNLFGGQTAQNPNETQGAKESSSAKNQAEAEEKKKKSKRKFLNSYCTNLTERAKEGKLDNVVGRDKEIYRTLQILSRRTKNNPCLIGEPGVGKTAIAEGLALRIAGNRVPFKLADKEIYLLDLTALVAGTQFRGQFESRVKGLIDEVKAEGNIILFIDEVHNLVGTGDAEGSMNAANILKPALSRGEIQVIGATTFNEYRKYIEKDAALERRFQPIVVEEPSVSDTISVLKGIKGYYEKHHNVTVSDGMLEKCAVMAERYINDRFLPDKAIDLLDESCACASLRNTQAQELMVLTSQLEKKKKQEDECQQDPNHVDYERLASIRADLCRMEERKTVLDKEVRQTVVTDDDLARVIELWTGIPVARIKADEFSKLAGLEEKMKSRIIGQDEAISLVAAAIKRNRVKLNVRQRPAFFIFVGPTGVGKTELVKVLSSELFDSPETLIRLDMSEFMEKHAVSRIIGSPPGYVGYDEAGQLTEKVRRKPYSVLLFDEIEKAHPDVMNIFLQIVDEGKVTDAHGRTVDFSNTVIVMTSNAGSHNKEAALGFGKTQDSANKEKAMKALSEFLRPEFLSRVDEIVVFHPLDQTSFEKIAVLMLDEFRQPLLEKGISLEYDGQVPVWLAAKSAGGKFGARDLRNLIRREVEDKLAALIVDSSGKLVSQAKLSVEEDKLQAVLL